MMTEKLIVSNMKCMGCANAVKNGVSSVKGVEQVYVDLSKSEVTVNYQGEIQTLKEIVEKLGTLGYPVVQ